MDVTFSQRCEYLDKYEEYRQKGIIEGIKKAIEVINNNQNIELNNDTLKEFAKIFDNKAHNNRTLELTDHSQEQDYRLYKSVGEQIYHYYNLCSGIDLRDYL